MRKYGLENFSIEQIDVADDLIKLACQHDLSYQISRYYLPLCSARVKEQISKSNQSLYNKIKETI